ncbi:MAG: hypothetical protein M3Q69_18010 [Acidobacteriota bacterium]|nr:hypothetical protein [Acidobacteriota bacterium]
MNTRSIFGRITSILVVFALAGAAFAGNAVGRATGGGASIEWQTAVTGHDRIQLTVVGPDGEAYVKEFPAGRNPSFRLQDLGGVAADGQYAFSLRVVPKVSADVQKKLKDAREKGDDAAARKIARDAGLGDAVTQSGTITILNGAFVDPNATEATSHDSAAVSSTTGGLKGTVAATGRGISNAPVTALDTVIADDLIVQSSACVGFDCVDGESFGFDTIRMKENNTQINFDDTSSTAGFPNNDWRIIANDSGSGGANKLVFNDATAGRNLMTITAAAPADSIFVASSGKVGFRQAAPALDLHITTGDTPAIRQEQTNASGFTAQTWDIGANEANWFVRDVTGGSRLPFRIRPGAPTSSIDIAASGNVGVGTASPSELLHASGIGNPRVFVTSTNTGTAGMNMQVSTSGTSVGFGIVRTESAGDMTLWTGTSGSSVNERMRILVGGNVGIGTSTPSSKLHVNGGDIRVSGGSFIDDGVTLNVPDYVFEETYKLMPIADLAKFVRDEKHLPNVPAAGDIKAAGLNLSQMQMRLLEKVEELTLYTLDQHEQIGTLKSENAKLLERLAALEAKIAQQQ